MAKFTSSALAAQMSEQTPVILSPESSPFKKRDPHNEANIRNNLCNSTPRSVKRAFGDAFDLSPVQSSKKSSFSNRLSSNISNNSFGENENENDDNSSLLGGENNENSDNSAARRGRPKLDAIKCLISSASDSKSAIRCHTCNRVFPREKSLQAHIRTHTGEKPYVCTFSGCTKRFTQSGQLRTHQRLHTGEKPFACRFQGCNNRFTHANRRCPLHPQHGVRRDRLGAQLSGSSSIKHHHSSKENQTGAKNVKLAGSQQVNGGKQSSKAEDVQKEVVNWLKKQSDQKSSHHSSYSSGIKRKLNGRPMRKIKKPKFLDDSSSSSSGEENNQPYNDPPYADQSFNDQSYNDQSYAELHQIVEELDEAEENDNGHAQLIWKKKRAALELHAKETFRQQSSIEHSVANQLEDRDPLNYSLDEVILKSNSSLDEHESSFQEDDVYDDRLVGALALIELSKSRPIVEYSSEMDMCDLTEYATAHEYGVNEVQVEHCSDYYASSQGDILNYSDLNYSSYSYNEEYY